MARTRIICAVLCALAAPVAAAAAQEKVKAWEEQITIPTYKVYPDNPYPFFDAGASGHKIYPYARQDNLSREREERSYTVLRIENEYLRVTVTPFMGKLHDIYDKVHDREVLYTNHVIKPTLIGVRGAWCSGGICYNFPFAHTVTAFSTVDTALRENPDGSASIIISDVERKCRMKWAVTLTLYPGKYYVEQAVTLYNRSDMPHRYYWWAIAAVHVNDDCQVIYPCQRVIEHWQTLIYSWPIADGRVESILKGKDISYHMNAPPHGVCWSAYLCKEDFFGYYDHQIDRGVVHYGDRNVLQGTKFWDWGKRPEGHWRASRVLTDDDGEYVEIDSGLYLTQTDFHFLPPQGVISWEEYWYPANGLKGCVQATPHGALNVVKENGEARVFLNGNQVFEDARLVVRVGEKEVLSRPLTVRPGEVFAETVPYLESAGKLSVLWTSKEGAELLSYVERALVPEEELPKPGVHPKDVKPLASMTVDEAYLEGMSRLRFDDDQEAISYFEGALQKDPGCVRAHNALGIIRYKRGMWPEAVAHFQASLERDPDQGAPHYYLGLIHKRHDRLAMATEAFWKGARKLDTQAVCRHYLGEVALAQNDPVAAIRHFEESLLRNGRSAKTRNCLAVAQRLAGHRTKALELNREILRDDPTNHWAAWESYLLTEEPGALERFRKGTRLVDNTHIELACDYASCGLYDVAVQSLRDVVDAKGADVFPMVYYYLGYFAKRAGLEHHADIYRKVGDLDSWAYVFPARLEAFAVLRDVVSECPDDYLAHGVLGNILFNKYHAAQAIEHWRRATEIVEALPQAEVARRGQFISVIYRNLGFACDVANHDAEEVFSWYEKGLEYGPRHAQYYMELGEVAQRAKKIDMGIKYLEAALSRVRKPSLVVKGLVPLHAAAGNNERILELVEGHEFDNWEGEYAVYNWYKDAHFRRGERLAAERKLEQAANELEKALIVPANLGIIPGVSTDGSKTGETKIHWRLAKTYEELENAELAQEHLERGASERPPGYALEELYYCALCLREIGRKKEAVKTFDEMLEHAGRSLLDRPDATKETIGYCHYYLGVAHEGKGDAGQAIEHLRACVRAFEEGGFTTNPLYGQAKARLDELEQ